MTDGKRMLPRLAVMIAVAAGACALACGGVHAQSALELWPTVTLGELYSDNVELTPQPISDEISSLIGGGTALLTSPARTVQLDYQTDVQVFAQHPSFNRYFQDQLADLRDTENLSPATSLWLQDSFFNGQSAFGQSLIGAGGVSPQLGQALQQANFLSNFFDLHLHHDFSEAISSDFDLHQSYFDASQGITAISNNQGGSLVFYRAMTSRLRLGLGYDFEDFRFSNEPRADAHEPAAYFQFSATPALSFNGQLGPTILQSPSQTQLGVGYSLASTYTRERWTASLSSGRMPDITAGFGGVGTSQFVTGTCKYQMSRRTSAYVLAYYDKLSGTASSVWLNYGAGVNWQVTRYVSIFGQYLGYRIDNPTGPTTTSDSVFVGITITPKPFRWMW